MKHEPARHPSGMTTKVWWPWLKRFATAAFFMLVAWLLVTQARAIEWGEVLATLANYPVHTLLVAAALALLSLTLYSSFDLLGRHYTGHTLRARTVMRVTFISYVFNLNLGSLVGGVALRYRLYARLGLGAGVITRVMTLSMLANWMVYLLLCAVLRQRSFILWGHELNLPSLRLATLQLGMGAANWLLMSGIVFILLQQKIAFPTVVSVLLVAAVASVIAHVPAGLGVLEAVFIALLSHQVPRHELLAALLAYRLIYYLAPLTLAAVLYLVAETRAKKSAPARRQGSAAADKELE